MSKLQQPGGISMEQSTHSALLHKELLAELWKMWNINNDKDKNCNSYKSNDDTKCSTGKVVHFFIAFQLFRMRDWKATKGPVSLPTS